MLGNFKIQQKGNGENAESWARKSSVNRKSCDHDIKRVENQENSMFNGLDVKPFSDFHVFTHSGPQRWRRERLEAIERSGSLGSVGIR